MRPHSWLLSSFFFALSLLPVDAARAEPVFGLDALGLAKHNARMLAEEMDPGMAIGFLDKTFGDPYPNLQLLIESGKVRAVRAHLLDGTCIRNHSCPSGAPRYEDLDVLRKRARRFGAFAARYPAIEWYVSPWLEHDAKDRGLVRRWYQVLTSEAPQARQVCSAFTGWCPSGHLRERHGDVRGDIVSPDGVPHTDLDSSAYRSKGREIVFSWIPQNNGRVSGETHFTPPQSRVDWPRRDDIRQQVRLLRSPAPEPSAAGCQLVRRPEVSKSNATYYGRHHDDGRGNKLLFIASHRYRRINVSSLAGHAIGHLTYYGPSSGGRSEHYIGGRYGSNQTPTSLMDALGGEWGILRSGARCWIFNAIRRIG